MKLTIEGTPEEIAAFLDARATRTESEPLRMTLPRLDFAAEPVLDTQADDDRKPPPQTISPSAIERLEFGVDSAGAPIDVAAVHRSIGELLRSPSFQRTAAANMPALDTFEPPMMLAKRFLYAHCIRSGKFDLGALDAFRARYILSNHAQNGSMNVTFDEN